MTQTEEVMLLEKGAVDAPQTRAGVAAEQAGDVLAELALTARPRGGRSRRVPSPRLAPSVLVDRLVVERTDALEFLESVGIGFKPSAVDRLVTEAAQARLVAGGPKPLHRRVMS